MGCDIHCILEMKGKDGLWKPVTGQSCLFKSYKEDLKKAITEQHTADIGWYTIRIAELRNEGEGKDLEWIFSDRNYNLFALLANVRNDYEFDSFFPERGLPVDVSQSVLTELEEWGEDAHSITNFSLKDLKEASWNRLATVTRIVEDSEWDYFTQHPELKAPRYWCGWSSSATAHSHSWTIKYSDIAERFFKIVVSKMEILSRHSPAGDEGVRLIVFFDN